MMNAVGRDPGLGAVAYDAQFIAENVGPEFCRAA